MTAPRLATLGLALFGAIDPTLASADPYGLSARPIDAVDLAQRFGWVPSASLAHAFTTLSGTDLMGLCAHMETLFTAANGTLKGPTSPLYRAFPHKERLPFSDDLNLLLTMIRDTKAWGNLSPTLFGADPFTGQQDDEFGADPLADAVFFQDSKGRSKGRLRVLHLAGPGFWGAKAGSLLQSRVALTPQELAFLQEAARLGYIDTNVLQNVRFREKLPLLAGCVAWDTYKQALDTPTDVLRLAASWSKGDTSLRTKVRFKLSTAQAKRVLEGLDITAQRDHQEAYEQIARHAERWKRLAIHIRTDRWAQRFPHAIALLDALRTGAMTTFNAQVEQADLLNKIALLSTRPGAYVRATLALLRADARAGGGASGFILEGLAKAMPKVNALTLLTLLVRLRHQGERWPHMLPNGTVLWSSPEPAPTLRACALVEGHLRTRLQGQLPWSAGPLAGDHLLPSAARSASESSERRARGDRLRIQAPDRSTLRLFLHWKESCDVDLSATFLNADGAKIGENSYLKLTTKDYAVHSGDIRNGAKGAAEYIDITLAKARKAGVRWVVMTANVFSGAAFNTFPAYAGVMVRDGVHGAHFDIETVAHKMRLTSPHLWNNVAVYDLLDNSLVMMDTHVRANTGDNVLSKTGSLVEDVAMVTQMARYRPDMALVLSLMGTPDGPPLDGDALGAEMDSILATLSGL